MAKAEEETNQNCTIQEKEKEEGKTKEGSNLLGSPTFKKLENGRFKCVETGHEMLAKDKESYSNSKRCRLGLIESFLSKKKPPLNMFKQDPVNKSKVICKLTGVTVNKSEEHIWKHINGKKFLNKLEQKETEKEMSNGVLEEDEEPPKESNPKANGVKKEKKKKKKNKKKGIKKDVSSEKMPVEDDDAVEDEGAMEDKSESEELDFWIPPVGNRWDFDDGKDRWGSDAESGDEESNDGDEIDADEKSGDESAELTNENMGVESVELSMRTKRMSIEIEPSSSASRKKSKTDSSNPSTS